MQSLRYNKIGFVGTHLGILIGAEFKINIHLNRQRKAVTMALIKLNIIPENLPLLQISETTAIKCGTEKPSNYVGSASRKILAAKLKHLREAYSLLVSGRYTDLGVGVDRVVDISSSVSPSTLKQAKSFIAEYNRIAAALLASYTYDICNSSLRKSSNVSAAKVLRQLMKKSPKVKGRKSAISYLGIGDHLIDSRHRLHGLSDDDAINLAISEIKKDEDSKPSEVARLVASTNRGMTLADCPKPTSSGSSSTASTENDSKTETYWYNNPLIMLTLGVGATVGVQQIIKRSRG